jgi:SAM-dependent methyltransferase
MVARGDETQMLASEPAWGNPGRIERSSILNGIRDSLQYVHGRLLDVGCREAPYQPVVAPNITMYVGCDLAPLSGPLRVQAAGERLPFVGGAFDTVLCTQVLDDLPEPGQLFEAVAQVLREGGHLVLTAPFFWRIHADADYFRFTNTGLQVLAERSGFQVVSIRSRGGFWATVGQMMSLYIWGIVGHTGAGRWIAGQLCGLVQSVALMLDCIHYDDRQTLGYILIARKRGDSM